MANVVLDELNRALSDERLDLTSFAENAASELEEVIWQRDLLREMVAIMEPGLTVQGRIAFEELKDRRARKIADELLHRMEGQSDG